MTDGVGGGSDIRGYSLLKNYADILTKALALEPFARFRDAALNAKIVFLLTQNFLMLLLPIVLVLLLILSMLVPPFGTIFFLVYVCLAKTIVEFVILLENVRV